MSKIGQILIKFSKVLFFGWNDACSQKKSPKAMFAIISVKIWVQKRQNGGFSMIYVHISAISHKKSKFWEFIKLAVFDQLLFDIMSSDWTITTCNVFSNV